MALIQTLTTEQLQAQLALQVKAALQKNVRSLVLDFTTSFNSIFNHPSLTPQQALDAFGTDAAALLVINQNFVAAINSIQAGAFTLTIPYELTPNQDGTVRVGAKL